MVWCVNCSTYNNSFVTCTNCGAALSHSIGLWMGNGTGTSLIHEIKQPQEGTKHDAGKPDLTLIRYDAIEQIARVFAFGAKKYGRNNYLAGMSHTRLLAAALRHIFDYLAGTTLDPESGLPSLAHAGCCVHMMLTYRAQNLGTDDRDVVPNQKEPQK